MNRPAARSPDILADNRDGMVCEELPQYLDIPVPDVEFAPETFKHARPSGYFGLKRALRTPGLDEFIDEYRDCSSGIFPRPVASSITVREHDMSHRPDSAPFVINHNSDARTKSDACHRQTARMEFADSDILHLRFKGIALRHATTLLRCAVYDVIKERKQIREHGRTGHQEY
jgi:hypothetical protein